jgi:hypothetical protein
MVVRAAGPECGSGAVHDHWPYPPWQTASSMESVRATGGGHCRRSYHCRRATAPDCTRAAGAHLAPRKLPCRGGSLPWLLHVMVDRLAACPAVLHVRGPPRPTDAVLRRLEAAADARGSVVKTRANQPWIGIAMEAQLRQVLALHVGDRRRDQAKERWAKRPLEYQAQAICHPGRFRRSGTQPLPRKRGNPITASASIIPPGRVFPAWYARPSRSPQSWRITSALFSSSFAPIISRGPPWQHDLCTLPGD